MPRRRISDFHACDSGSKASAQGQCKRLQHLAAFRIFGERDDRQRAPIFGKRKGELPARVTVRVERRTDLPLPHNVIVGESLTGIFPGFDVAHQTTLHQCDHDDRVRTVAGRGYANTHIHADVIGV